MPTPSRQLLSRTIYDTDGVTVNWDFSFSGGYLDRGHVKAYVDLPTGERTELTVTAGMFTGPYQLAITPAILSGRTLTIYRDTPKDLPLVDFTDGSGFSEVSLDIMAKQAVFVSAESVDTLNTSSNYEAAVAADAAQVSQLAAAASAASAAVSANSAATSAASINPASFATAAQGARADTAIQPAGFTVTAINGATSLGRNLMAVVDAAAARVLLGLSTFGSSLVQAADAAVARVLLGAAASGANSDITSLTALVSATLQHPGEVCFFARSTPPLGFLKANGATVSRTTYAALFAAIGTTFGVGDGTTTFALPDLRGEFLRGWDDSRGVDSGRAFGSSQAQDLQPHTHTINPVSIQSGAAVGGNNNLVQNGGGSWATGSTGTTETRPRNIALLACIKF